MERTQEPTSARQLSNLSLEKATELFFISFLYSATADFS